MNSQEFRQLVVTKLPLHSEPDSYLDISYNDFSEKQLEIFLSLLSQKRKVTKINLTQVILNDQKSLLLNRFLNRYNSLLHLNLSYCALMSKHLKTLTSGLSSSGYLKTLSLVSNFFCSEGIEHLKNSFLNHKSLKKLNLSKNSLDYKACRKLSTLLEINTSLQLLEMSDCGLSCQALLNLQPGLRASSSLKYLDLSYNNIQAQGCLFLSQALAKGSQLKSLNLNSNNITDGGLSYLCFALRKNSLLQDLSIHYPNQSYDLFYDHIRPNLFYNKKRTNLIRKIGRLNHAHSLSPLENLPPKKDLFPNIAKFCSSKDLMSFYLAWRSDSPLRKGRTKINFLDPQVPTSFQKHSTQKNLESSSSSEQARVNHHDFRESCSSLFSLESDLKPLVFSRENSNQSHNNSYERVPFDLQSIPHREDRNSLCQGQCSLL